MSKNFLGYDFIFLLINFMVCLKNFTCREKVHHLMIFFTDDKSQYRVKNLSGENFQAQVKNVRGEKSHPQVENVTRDIFQAQVKNVRGDIFQARVKNLWPGEKCQVGVKIFSPPGP